MDRISSKNWSNFISVARYKFELRDDGQVCRCQRPATNETGTKGIVARKLIRHSLTAPLWLRSKLHPHSRGKKSHGGTLLSHFSRSTWKTEKHSASLYKNTFSSIHYGTAELKEPTDINCLWNLRIATRILRTVKNFWQVQLLAINSQTFTCHSTVAAFGQQLINIRV